MKIVLTDLVEAITQAQYSATELLPEYGSAVRYSPSGYEITGGINRRPGSDYETPNPSTMNRVPTEYQVSGGTNSGRKGVLPEIGIGEKPGSKVNASYSGGIDKESLGSRAMGPSMEGAGPSMSGIEETFRAVPGSFKRLLLEKEAGDEDLGVPLPPGMTTKAMKDMLKWIADHGGSNVGAAMAVPPSRMAAAWTGNLQQLGLDQSSVNDYADYYSKIINDPLNPINLLTKIPQNLGASGLGWGVLNRLSGYGLNLASGLNNQILNLAVRATLDPRANVPKFTQERGVPTNQQQNSSGQVPPEGVGAPVPVPVGGGFGAGRAVPAKVARALPSDSHEVDYNTVFGSSDSSSPSYTGSGNDMASMARGERPVLSSPYNASQMVAKSQPKSSLKGQPKYTPMTSELAYGGPLRNKPISTGYSVS